MKRWFLQLSIVGKLRLLITAACAAMIVLTCGAFLGYEWVTFRRQLVSILTVRAGIVADNLSPALAFENPEDAEAVLRSLQNDPHTVKALVFDKTGRLLAGFPEGAVAAGDVRPVVSIEHAFEADQLIVWAPVQEESVRLGTTMIAVTTAPLERRIRLFVSIAGGVLGLGGIFAFWLSKKLAALFSGPVIRLAQAARRVTATRDYESGVPRSTGDEIGTLTDDFNAMVAAVKERENALMESSARSRSILDSALDAILVCEQDGRILESNPAAEAIFGMAARDMPELRLSDLVLPPCGGVHQSGDLLQGSLLTGATPLAPRAHCRGRRRDGTVFPVELTLTRVQRGAGNLFISFVRDITERHRADEAIRRSEERFRSLVLASAQIVWSTDPEGRMVEPSPTWSEFTGQPADQAAGRGWLRMLHPEDLPGVEVRWAAAVKSRTQYVDEYRLQRRDGGFRRFQVRAIPIAGPDRRVDEWIGTCTDVTQQRQAEEELKRTADWLAALNRLGRIISSNLDLAAVFDLLAQEMRALLTFDRAALVVLLPGRGEWEVVHQWSRTSQIVPVGFRGPLAESALEWTARHKQPLVENVLGERWSEVHLARQIGMKSRVLFPLIFQEEVLGVFLVSSQEPGTFAPDSVAFLQALSDQLAVALHNSRLYGDAQRVAEELERRVAERTRQLEDSNRELEAFSYSVSHDLRAPLRAMAGFSNILLNEYADRMPAEASRYAGRIQHAARKMGQLVDDLLAFSRLGRQALVFRAVDLAQVFRAVADELRSDYAGRSVELEIGPMNLCRGDPSLLKQVAANLLSNAFKYTRGRHPARILVGQLSESEQGRVIYFVKDNGVGFDMRFASKLFRVFQRLHRTEDFDGTGVGLAIVQRIIHRHGGRIWADSAVDVGTTFYFTLEPTAA